MRKIAVLVSGVLLAVVIPITGYASAVTPATPTTPTSLPQAYGGQSGAFTPDGQGTVVDNVTESQGKEFFTVKTTDDSEFFLVIDRQRSSDNVYLLKTVSNADLLALAQGNPPTDETTAWPFGGKSNENVSAETPVDTEQAAVTPEVKPETTKPFLSKNLLYAGGATILFGAFAYYIKVVKPKKKKASQPPDEESSETEYFEGDYFDEGEEAEEDAPVVRPTHGIASQEETAYPAVEEDLLENEPIAQEAVTDVPAVEADVAVEDMEFDFVQGDEEEDSY